MFTVTVTREDGRVMTWHANTPDGLVDVIAREQARGSEIGEIGFPDE